MAESTPELKQIIQRYRAQLEKMGVTAERILLYGSHPAGSAREGSDIDLIVVSKDWEKFSNRQRLEILGVAAARILEPVQAQGFTPAEIERGTLLPFWDQIIRYRSVAV